MVDVYRVGGIVRSAYRASKQEVTQQKIGSWNVVVDIMLKSLWMDFAHHILGTVDNDIRMGLRKYGSKLTDDCTVRFNVTKGAWHNDYRDIY